MYAAAQHNWSTQSPSRSLGGEHNGASEYYKNILLFLNSEQWLIKELLSINSLTFNTYGHRSFGLRLYHF